MQNQERRLMEMPKEDIFAAIPHRGTKLVEFAHQVREQERIKFLEWIRKIYHPRLLLYAGSGFDQIPKHIFGESTVVHLSFEEDDRSYTKGYFLYLGDGMKVGANFLHTPLQDKSIAAVYIHDSPYQVTSAAVEEFHRVLYDGGILILDNGDWTMEQVDYFLKRVECYFRATIIPPEFCNPDHTWREITDTQYNPRASGCGAIIGWSYTLAHTQELLNDIPFYRRSIRAQCFGIFEKLKTY